MSKIITIINMKGGVGKTTLSVNIAYCLARFHSKKVLVVDIIPQFNATQYLVKQDTIIEHFRNKKTIYDILVPSKDDEVILTAYKKSNSTKVVNLNDYVIQINKFPNSGQLDLIPSSLKLINFESTKRGLENLLKKFLEDKCSQYDFIIIDCPPTLSLLTLSAYLASKYYLIPIKPDYLSSLGLPLLDRGLKEYEVNYDHSLILLGIVFTMVDHRPNLSQNIIDDIEESGWDCFSNSSSHSTRVAESVNSLDNFYYYSKFAPYSQEFKLITQELLNKIDGI